MLLEEVQLYSALFPDSHRTHNRSKIDRFMNGSPNPTFAHLQRTAGKSAKLLPEIAQ